MAKERLSERAGRIASSIYVRINRRKEHAAFVVGYIRGFKDARREPLHKLMEIDDGKDNHI